MNYFAHALPFLDRPHFLAGTAVPDWMMVADRPLRLRAQHAEACLNDSDPCTAEVAAGVVRASPGRHPLPRDQGVRRDLVGVDCQRPRRARGRNRLAADLSWPPVGGAIAGRCLDRRLRRTG